jgi:hypothetical protein
MALSMLELIKKAREELKNVTGLDLSATLGAVRKNSNWCITVEMIEKHSIPDQMDILAVYETILDDEGNLIEFKRKGMRKRVDTEASDLE